MWIESHAELRHHPKLLRLVEHLDKGIAQTVGHLHLLWWWTLTYRPDGVLTGLNDKEIATASYWGYDAKTFVKALIDCGFIDRKDGVLTIHDWQDYAGEFLRRRLKRLSDKRHIVAGQCPSNGGQCPPTQTTTPTQTTVPKQPTSPAGAAMTWFTEMVSLLMDVGFDKKGASRVAIGNPQDKVRKAIEMSKSKTNPPGWIVEALKKGWV
jgi:hypothetical protein